MKKTIRLLPIFLITCACSAKINNEPLTCTTKEETEEINTEIAITTEFEDGKAISAKAQATMYFETNEEAQDYYDAYTEDKASLKVEDNKIIITLEDSFEQAGKNRSEAKKSFEDSGYVCN